MTTVTTVRRRDCVDGATEQLGRRDDDVTVNGVTSDDHDSDGATARRWLDGATVDDGPASDATRTARLGRRDSDGATRTVPRLGRCYSDGATRAALLRRCDCDNGATA
jgi:hypothetical protein